MLDTRLEMIYRLIRPGIICDVGTDHCKLAAAAVTRGKSELAYATDINKGPLAAAERLVEKLALSDSIKLILSDGFKDIPSEVFEKVDCFIIAGMGGELIRSIIAARHTEKPIVVQPMTAERELAAFFANAGYDIEKRVFCKDGDKIYTALRVRYDGVKREPCHYGATERTDVYREYLEKELAKHKKAIDGMKSAASPDSARIEFLYSLIKEIEKELER